MIKRTALFTLLLALASASHAHAECNSSVAARIASGMLRITNRHAYLFSLPIAPWTYSLLTKNPRHASGDEPISFCLSLINWYIAGRLLKTTTKVIMDECGIEPLQD